MTILPPDSCADQPEPSGTPASSSFSARQQALADAALGALGWILADDARAQRFLDMTGMTPDVLRSGLDAPATQTAIIDFLCAHEPDLIAAAGSLGMEPAALASFGSAATFGEF